MQLGWQDLVALGIVFAAAGYLTNMAWQAVFRKRASGCGSACGKCSAAETRGGAPEQVVSIGGLGDHASAR
jgi:hypothetical protein